MLRLLLSVRLVAPVVVAVALALAVATTHAQGAPRIGVTPTLVEVGASVTIDASGLPRGAEHTVRITAPSGAQTVVVRSASATGTLQVSVAIEEAGASRVRLSGPTVDALFVVTATGPEAAAEPAPPDDPAPNDPLPADPPPAEADGAPEEPTPADSAPTPTALEFVIEDGAAQLLEPDGSVRWTFERRAGSGDTRFALLHDGVAWVAHGHQVIELDVDNGRALRRTPLSGPIVALVPIAAGVRATVEVGVAGGTLEYDHVVSDGVASPVAQFDPASPLFGWAAREADVADPAALIAVDPTNPHLHVRVASLAATASERRDHVEGALDTATTFFDLAAVARGLVALEEWDAADEAMRRALEDFVARGYDPDLLTDAAVHERYAFPLRPLRQAVDRGDRVSADFWAPWLVVTAAPELPGTGTTLRAYADLLAASGDAEEGAAAWRERARAFGPLSAHGVVGNMALGLGRGGWYAAVALLIATLLLHLTLIAKYWRPQTLLLRQAAASGRVGPLPRWRFMRYYGLTEKVALLVLLVAAYAAAALAVWAVSGDVGVRAASAGHLEAPFVGPVITSATADPARLAGLEGYLAGRRGEPERARVAYEQALSLGDPDAGAALDALEAGTRVPGPTRLALREAVSGTWPGAIGRAFVDPFGFVADEIAAPRVPAWAWPIIIGVFLLVGLVHVLALFVPRPRVARNAPRTLAYHVLSVLIPGSGAADELYGVLLLVPAAVFGLDAFMQLVGVGSPLGIPLRTSAWILVMLHAVNLVAFGVEYASYRRRMRDLRREQPELAHAFGMRELRAEG